MKKIFGKPFDSGPKIQFGFRGEGIEYQDNGKDIFIASTWIDGERIYTDSIIKWEKGDNLSPEEKKKIFVEIIDFVRHNSWKKPIIVINIDIDGEFWRSVATENLRKIKKIEFTSNKEQDQQLYNMFLDDMYKGLTIDGVEIKTKEELDKYWKTKKWD